MSEASWKFVVFAGGARPRDPVALADFETSVADLRAAVCLEAGVSPDDISPLGYDHSEAAYERVRLSWVRHIEQFGLTMFRTDVEDAQALWLAARPDLARGDDWRAAGAAAHKAANPAGRCFRTERADICVICEGGACRARRWPASPTPKSCTAATAGPV